MRIAIVGAGVAGLGAAWVLDRYHDVTLFEAAPRLGGHANTVEIKLGGRRVPVDTGFIVYNEVNYPLLTRMLAHLQVDSEASNMSFAASIDGGALEYSGSHPGVLFAQKRNLARPAFLRMVADILRFNAAGKRFIQAGGADNEMTLGEFLDRGRFGQGLRSWYLLPMAAAIWSAPIATMLRFPARSFLAFFVNHGLLNINDRPVWRTVRGGSRAYVDRIGAALGHRARCSKPVRAVNRIAGGIAVTTWSGERYLFDHVVLACHADQTLRLLADATPAERAALAALPCQPNRAVLHADSSLMPRRRTVWSSWNYVAESGMSGEARISVTYWMNRLQNLRLDRELFVSLNPIREPDPALTFGGWSYDHPVFDAEGLRAQRAIEALQAKDRVSFAGAWLGYGFHEDGLRSGLDAARRLGALPPWEELGPRRHDTSIGLPERAAAHPV